MVGGAGIIDGNDGYEDDYSPSSKVTLSTGERRYVPSGTTYFSYYSNNYGIYRIYIEDMNYVNSFNVRTTSTQSNVSNDYYSDYYQVTLSSYTSYDITVSSNSSYYIEIEYIG